MINNNQMIDHFQSGNNTVMVLDLHVDEGLNEFLQIMKAKVNPAITSLGQLGVAETS